MAPPKRPPRRRTPPAPKVAKAAAERIVPQRKGWGSVARKGAGVVKEDKETASEAWQRVSRTEREARESRGERQQPAREEWVRDDDQRPAKARPTTEAKPAPGPRRKSL